MYCIMMRWKKHKAIWERWLDNQQNESNTVDCFDHRCWVVNLLALFETFLWCIKLHNCVIHCAELLHACKHNSVPCRIITHCIKWMALFGRYDLPTSVLFSQTNNHLHSSIHCVSSLLSFLYIKSGLWILFLLYNLLSWSYYMDA